MSKIFCRGSLVCPIIFFFLVHSLWASTAYPPEFVNPAIVPDPLIYSYAQCYEKYGFCTCELVGASDPASPAAGIDTTPYDLDGNGLLGFAEMREARNWGFWNDEQLGDSTFLACHYDPPSPGPYDPFECEKLFGESDCVCVSHMGQHFGQCFSRTIVMASPEPVSVPEEYCDHRTPGGFENCYCDVGQTDAWLGGEVKCYVMPSTTTQTWECETDTIRIFSGSKYTCRTLDGAVFSPDCCPGELSCAITEYNAGNGTLQMALTGASYALKAYLTYQGYAATAAAYGTSASIGSFLAGGGATTAAATSAAGTTGVTGTVQAYQGYYAAGQALNPALAALGMAMAYVALAYALYTFISGMYNTCKDWEYELACKDNGSLCIYTGEECVASGFTGCRKRVKVFMCYASQIAKIVNEYGLPQLHDPGCHIDNCNASFDGDQCGCINAYTIDGSPTQTRHTGFTIDEFQRLDFGQIPIAQSLAATMMPSADSDDAFADIEALTAPSSLLAHEAETSLTEQAPPVDQTNPTHTVINIGGCTYNGDEMVFPITASDTEIVTFTPGTAYTSSICISSPFNKPGRIYAVNMSMSDEEWERVSTLSTSPGMSALYDICNPRYISQGWGDIGTFLATTSIMSGTFFSGSNCWQPVHYDNFFYSTVPWYHDSMAVEELVVTRNTIFAKDQTLLRPEETYVSDTFKGWGEFWAYWLAEEDIQRGKWLAVDGKCFIKDTGQPVLTPPLSPTDISGNPLYDENGFNPATGQYFKDDPICVNWYVSEIIPKNLKVNLNNDCTLSSEKEMGENIIPIDASSCPSGFTQGTDCFCTCPPLIQDMENTQMICPRPNKNNLIQRVAGYVSPSAFNAYYGRSDVKLRYEPYIP
ncbi:Putative Type IV conjugative transfer system mating-pair stabilization protein TraN domain-containing protein [Desulfonema limicola]|uniref:Type IV conjugative transfer system mating-pair stabilization protein TraN domain-containing protein n=1 Tax=Desulfonema limicola TaxID=45656 RepID=A0A975B461_9BACT|nr:conjugal transfer protein TraN [Desulfonema limicola]QTA78475.1 Putative Type IV conjugative transfer system mating-pair stabilization protein TraN domain-containing protein [Desulfonema limicola]